MAIRKRIGVLVPATNTTVEPDFHRAAAQVPGLTIHSHRLWLTNEAMFDRERGMDRMNSELEQAAWYLAQGKVVIVTMVGTTNSFYKGPDGSAEMERIMSRGAGGLPAISTSPSVAMALKHFGAKRISVATPYPEWNNERLHSYFEAMGFSVLNVEGEPWAAKAGSQGINDQEPEVIIDFSSKVCRPEADALFLACTAWRAAEAAEALEARLKKPVVTSVQATLWRTFFTAGISQPLQGFGALLREMPAPPA